MRKEITKVLEAEGLGSETSPLLSQASSLRSQQLSTQHSALNTGVVIRRAFLQLMGASLALAGFSACVTIDQRRRLSPTCERRRILSLASLCFLQPRCR